MEETPQPQQLFVDARLLQNNASLHVTALDVARRYLLGHAGLDGYLAPAPMRKGDYVLTLDHHKPEPKAIVTIGIRPGSLAPIVQTVFEKG